MRWHWHIILISYLILSDLILCTFVKCFLEIVVQDYNLTLAHLSVPPHGVI